MHRHGVPKKAVPLPCLERTQVTSQDDGFAMNAVPVFHQLQPALCHVVTLLAGPLPALKVLGLDVVLQIGLLARFVIAVFARKILLLVMKCLDMLFEISTPVGSVVAEIA